MHCNTVNRFAVRCQLSQVQCTNYIYCGNYTIPHMNELDQSRFIMIAHKISCADLHIDLTQYLQQDWISICVVSKPSAKLGQYLTGR